MGAATKLDERMEKQLGKIKSANARVAGLTGDVAEFANHVSSASDMATSARTSAEQSGAIVRQATDAMDRIIKSSQEISRTWC